MADEDDCPLIITISNRKTDFKSIDNTIWKPTQPRRKICRPEKSYERPSSAMLKKYSLPGSKPLPVSTLKEDALLISSAKYMKQVKADRFRLSTAIPLKKKYKIANIDLRQRLHVEIPANDVITITNTDAYFYKLVDGRQLCPKVVPSYKSLKQINSHLRVRQEIGYNRDCTIRIQNNKKKELEVYNASLHRCTEQAKLFEQFISFDYAKSMVYLQNWEELQIKLHKKNIEMQNLANEMFTITSKLIGYDYKFRIQQKYGRFLYYLSPPCWRIEHRDFARSTEIETMGFDLGAEDGDDPFVVVFERLKKQCSIKHVKPALYFTEPHHVIDIFEGIEKQLLHHFTHVTHVTPHTRKLNSECKTLRANIKKDSAGFKSDIIELQSHVVFLEDKADYLERKFHKIIHGFFYDCVGSLEVLKLLINLQFCHERINGDSPTHLDLTSLAKFLENVYMFYIQWLEYSHSDTVKRALERSIAAERRKWNMAHQATRELRAFAEMNKALVMATSPRFVGSIPSPQPRKKHLQKKKPGVKSVAHKEKKASKVALTDAKNDYLPDFVH